MATFTNTTFTNATSVALESHSGETGAVWTQRAGGFGSMVVESATGRARLTVASTSVLYTASGVPASADYHATATLFSPDLSGIVNSGVLLRFQDISNFYLAEYNDGDQRLYLWKVVGGVWTELGRYTYGAVATTAFQLTGECIGSTLRVLLNGTEVIPPVTDSTHTAKGEAGIFGWHDTVGPSNGVQFDTFTAADGAAAGGGGGGGTPLAAGTLSSTGQTSTSITLSTTPASGGTSPYSYQLQRAPDVSGSPGTWVTEGAAQATTTWTVSGLTASTVYWFRYIVTDSATTPATATSNQLSVATSASAAGNALTIGTLTLTATYESIGVKLAFTGDANANATAALAFSSDGGTTWRNALPMWRTDDTVERAFYGSCLLLTAGTTYTVRVTVADAEGVTGTNPVTGTRATRTDNITSPEMLYVVATRFVDPVNGSNSNPGTSEALAWKTLGYAIANAGTNAVIGILPGTATQPELWLNVAGQRIVPKYTPVATDGTEINAGKQSVIEYAATEGAPAVWSDPGGSSWVSVQLVGPNDGVSRQAWRWNGTAITNPQVAYTTGSRAGALKRLAGWKNPNNSMPAARWREFLALNAAFHSGTFWDNTTLYAIFPGNVDPNTLYVNLARGAAVRVLADDTRLCGVKIRNFGEGVFNEYTADRTIIDHCLIENAYSGVQITANKDVLPNVYPVDITIQYNRFQTENTWSQTQAATGTKDSACIAWNAIKGQPADAYGSVNRACDSAETQAVNQRGGGLRTVIRHNLVDGPFNGFYAYNPGYDRDASRDTDIYGNTLRHIADDVLEPEGTVSNWRVWNNRIEWSAVGMSTGPVHYGPIYFFRNIEWKIGGEGVGRDDAGDIGVGACLFKYSGGSSPQARVYCVHNTFWTDLTYTVGTSGGPTGGVDGLAKNAGGVGFNEAFYMRNNLVRTTRYASVATGKWDENFNHFVTAAAARGLSFNGTNYTTNVPGYRSAVNATYGYTPSDTNTAGDFITVSVIDNALTNPATGDVTLKSGSVFLNVGTPVANISDQPSQYSGAAPDLGATEFGTTGGTAPAAPTGLTATAVSATQVNVAWTDNATDETSYRVERGPSTTGPWTVLAVSLAANTTAYSDTTALESTTYAYRVAAVNAAGTTYSSTASATTPLASPAAPTALTVVAVSATQVDLSWTDNATNEASYRVERGPATTGPWTVLTNALAANTTAYSDTTTAASTTYAYRVAAVNAAGTTYSTAVSVTTPALTVPAPPSNLLPLVLSPHEVQLTWTESPTPGVDSIIVEESADGGVTWREHTRVGVTA